MQRKKSRTKELLDLFNIYQREIQVLWAMGVTCGRDQSFDQSSFDLLTMATNLEKFDGIGLQESGPETVFFREASPKYRKLEYYGDENLHYDTKTQTFWRSTQALPFASAISFIYCI